MVRPAGSYSAERARIGFNDGVITHNEQPCRVVMRRDLISIGCSDVTIEAMRELVKQYEDKFGDDREFVIQT